MAHGQNRHEKQLSLLAEWWPQNTKDYFLATGMNKWWVIWDPFYNESRCPTVDQWLVMFAHVRARKYSVENFFDNFSYLWPMPKAMRDELSVHAHNMD